MAYTVDGAAVEKAELLYYMRDRSSVVAAQLEEEYGIDSFEDGFWGKTYGDVTPLEELKSYASDEITRVKLLQLLAKEHGKETPLRWSEQQKELEQENKERKAAYEAGQIVYGRIERDMTAYLADMISSCRYYLMEEMDLTEEQLEQRIDQRLQDAQIQVKDMAIDPDEIN